jgi:hypothetical protein
VAWTGRFDEWLVVQREWSCRAQALARIANEKRKRPRVVINPASQWRLENDRTHL